MRVEEPPPADLAGQAVLIVDDTLDSGETLARAVARLRGSGPAWLRTCVLLDKPSQRTAAFSVDYVGFTVPDL